MREIVTPSMPKESSAPLAPNMLPQRRTSEAVKRAARSQDEKSTPLELLKSAMGPDVKVLDNFSPDKVVVRPLDPKFLRDFLGEADDTTRRALLPYKIKIGQTKHKHEYGHLNTAWAYLYQHKMNGDKGVPTVKYFRGTETYKSVTRINADGILEEVTLREEFPEVNDQDQLAATVKYYFFAAGIELPFPINITDSFRTAVRVAANNLRRMSEAPKTAPAMSLTRTEPSAEAPKDVLNDDLGAQIQKHLFEAFDKAAKKKSLYHTQCLEIRKQRLEAAQQVEGKNNKMTELLNELQLTQQEVERLKADENQLVQKEKNLQRELGRVSKEEKSLLKKLNIERMEALLAKAKDVQQVDQAGVRANKRRRTDGDSL
ncbi:hypothetical protein K458DRAFT_460808 [Lentithecium fluviatile CBS 122367]|uniref:Uncharacterized protein n=1 Tax=Lentithecium fluviatile CBS 122367 TaxID=1168545 RepID=A0A6G1INC2_9PLEO|nr:hypothetical protein K458DRAFT_460808 [Lentithecium fluviatile CBS 122367]